MPRRSKASALIPQMGTALARREAPPASRNPAVVYLASLTSPHSRRTMRTALERIAEKASGRRLGAEVFPWHELRYPHTQALRSWLADTFSPAGANLRLAALRGVLREAWRLGLMDAETYHRAVDLKGVRGERLPRGRALSQGELRATFKACAQDPTPLGARDAAALALLFGGGLRRSEVVALDLADLDPETGVLRIHGKGNKERVAYAGNGSLEALEAWLEHRGEAAGPLLWPATRGAQVVPGRLSTQALRRVCVRRATEAGIAPFSPHDLRRSFVSELLDAGADVSVVRGLAGHSNVATTARYDRRPEAAKRRAASLLAVPYRRK